MCADSQAGKHGYYRGRPRFGRVRVRQNYKNIICLKFIIAQVDANLFRHPPVLLFLDLEVVDGNCISISQQGTKVFRRVATRSLQRDAFPQLELTCLNVVSDFRPKFWVVGMLNKTFTSVNAYSE